MAIKILNTNLEGVLTVEPDYYPDDRGFFFESYNARVYSEAGINVNFVQDNVSKSTLNTIRGLHYQIGESAQGKLCQVVKGIALDVAVDIRFGSSTFGKYFAVELSGEKHNQIWIPPGFAHGFSVLTDEVIFMYKCTNFYNKNDERAILFCDTDLNIDWKVSSPVVSQKDLSAKKFKDIEKDFIY